MNSNIQETRRGNQSSQFGTHAQREASIKYSLNALEGMRNNGGHAIRHLEGILIPNTGSLENRVNAFRKIALPILQSPVHKADWRIGATNGIAHLGKSNGKYVVIVVAKDGPYKDKVISSFIPDNNQLNLIRSK